MASIRSEYTIGVRDEVSGPVARMSASLSKFAGALGGLGAIGAAGGLAVVATRLRSAVDMADSLNKTSQKVGTTVERLSALQYAARLSDVSTESLAGALAKLSRQMDQAAQGAKGPAAAFTAIGVAVKNADGTLRDSTEVLSDIARVFATLPDGATKTALAIQLFGRAGAELVPLLNSGADGFKAVTAEARAFGVVLSKDLAQQAEDLKDDFERLAAASDGISISLATGVVPALASLSSEFVRAYQESSGMLRVFDAMGTALSRLVRGDDMQRMGELLLQEIELEKKIANLQSSFDAGREGKLPFTLRMRSLKDELAAVKKEAEGLRVAMQPEQLGGAPARADRPTGPTPEEVAAREARIRAALEGQAAAAAETKERERQAKAQEEYLARLREAVAVQGQATELAKVEADIKFGSAAKFSQAAQDEARALAESLDIARDSAEVHEYLNGLVRDRAELEAQAATKMAERRQAVIDSLMTPLEEYVSKVQELVDLGFEGDTLARGIAKAKGELDDAQKQTEKLTSTAESLGLTFSSAFEDAIVGGEGLRDVLDGISKDVARLLIRESVTKPFANLFGNWIGGLFGQSAGGGGFSNPGGLGLFGNATGGVYKIAGSGSGERPFMMTGQPGEIVAVGQPGGARGSGLRVVINNYSSERVAARESGDGRRDLEITVGNLLAGNVRAGRGTAVGMKPALASR